MMASMLTYEGANALPEYSPLELVFWPCARSKVYG
jgi:hypothetical protein